MYVKHGLRKHPAYSCWADMIKRCENVNHQQYNNYGGRGISVCKEWREDFSVFLKDMGERPAGATIERKDVNCNYCPENCRWEIDRGVQAYNTGPRIDNKSGKAGVMWDSQRSKWRAFIHKNKKRIFLGRFDDLEEAIAARIAGEILYYGELKSA